MAQPVSLDDREVYRALAQLGRKVRPVTNPQQAARQLFELGARSGWYNYEARGRRLVPAEGGEHLQEEVSALEAELTRAYLSWCERKGTHGDCMRLLMGGPTINGDGRYALAMAFMQSAVWDEMKEAFKGLANPDAVMSMVLWTCTTYLLLLAVPEPLSKGIAAVMTAALIAWVGIDTFWNLIVGFKHMVEEADRAVTFDDLRQAGARYGKVMGRSAAHAFVMLATAVLGTTLAGFAGKIPTLPGAAEAAVQAGGQLGISLSGVGAVTAVGVNAGALSISLTSGAVVVMAMQGREGEGNGSSHSAKTPQGAPSKVNVWNAQHPKLKNLVAQMYRPSAKVGTGSTADAIRYEIRTGNLLSRSGHSTKGREMISALNRLIETEVLSEEDREIVRYLIADLKDALATTPGGP